MATATPTLRRLVRIPSGADGRLERPALTATIEHGFRVVRWHRLGQEGGSVFGAIFADQLIGTLRHDLAGLRSPPRFSAAASPAALTRLPAPVHCGFVAVAEVDVREGSLPSQPWQLQRIGRVGDRIDTGYVSSPPSAPRWYSSYLRYGGSS